MKSKRSRSQKRRSHKQMNPFIPRTSQNFKERIVSTDTKANNKPASPGFMDSMKMLGDMAGNFSKKSNEFQQMIQAFQSFSRAFQDQNSFKQMIGALAKLNQSQLKPPTSPKGNTTKANIEEKKPLLGGTDTLFDLVNSPGLNDLVKAVLNTRGKKK